MQTEKKAHIKFEETNQKYALPYQWVRERFYKYGIVYFGYMEIIKEIFSKLEKGYVLDAGCGDGRVAWEIQKLGHKVLGIDVMERSIQYAKILVPDAEFKVADLVNLDKDETLSKKFDYVNCTEIIEHVHPDYQTIVLKNLNKVLKPRRKIIISFPTVRTRMSKLHYKHFTLEEAKALLDSAGFEIEQVINSCRVNLFSRILLSDRLWRLLWNRYWRLIAIGKLIDSLYLRFINYSDDRNAGRYIIIGVKKR